MGGLEEAVEYALPKNYDFEIAKTIRRIREEGAVHVGLQFPEGLLIYADQISTILTDFAELRDDDGNAVNLKVTILGDVTYGACCIDDLTSKALGIQLLVHYGHSCLVPLNEVSVKCLYVFVRISFDFSNLVETLKLQFPPSKEIPALTDATVSKPANPLQSSELPSSHPLSVPTNVFKVFYVMGTIQYSWVVHAVRSALQQIYSSDEAAIVIPQEKPLTSGEVLGCTSPNLHPPEGITARMFECCIFISDGRFHLESVMIANPNVFFLRFDPFLKRLFYESYDHEGLYHTRREAIKELQNSKHVGLVLGVLGRQGSYGIHERLINLLYNQRVKSTLLLMSELLPEKLNRLGDIDAFIQVACPRLSIDWGHCTSKAPLLTPYEAFVAFDGIPFQNGKHQSDDIVCVSVYPMDFYSLTSQKPWTNYFRDERMGSLKVHHVDMAERRARIKAKALGQTRNSKYGDTT